MRYIILPLLILGFLSGCSPTDTLDRPIQKEKITIETSNGNYIIQAISNDIIKISFEDSLIKSSDVYAPVLNQSIQMEVSETDSIITAKTEKIKLVINKSPFKASYFTIDGKLKMTTKGVTRFGDSLATSFTLRPEESIYGTGFRAIPMNRRGHSFLAYNKPQYAYGEGATELNYSIPHWMSSNDYMMLIDNPSKAFFDIGKSQNDKLVYSSYKGNMSFYFINGNSFKELIGNYTALTGKQPLPPLWAMGNFQSRFGYKNQNEAETILNKSIKAGYSTDAIILDIYWFGPEIEDGKMGDLNWDLSLWPQPKQMISNFKDKGVKTVLITEPFFTKKSRNYEYLSKNGLLAYDKNGSTYDLPNFYFGNGGILDIFNPEAKKWMWNEYKRLKEYGVDGWWVDLGEPETHPDSILHKTGMGYEVHGIYGHEWAKMMSEGFAKDYPDERLFLLARAGFAGTQRYGLIPWSGDVGRNWSGLKPQPSIMLSMGLSGIGYMHSDAGGFTFVEKGDPELYTRWVQFATFTPIFRPHADNSAPAEPVMWNNEVQNNVKPFVDLRYKMLPYNYTLAWENATTGMPLARPMFVEYPEVSDTLNNQYMWGKNLLVAPILNPGVSSRKVYLPEGNWYNFWNNEKYKGGQWVEIPVTMENIPVFVKSGSILPTTDLIHSTDIYKTDTVNIHYYYDQTSSSQNIFFDDGKSRGSLENNQYQVVSISTTGDNDKITFNYETKGEGYKGNPESRVYKIIVHGLDSNPVRLTEEYKWNAEDSTLEFYDTLEEGKTITIRK
ncbi:glycoside hydrolase family 31 protein [Marinigracilibium pacificum]|uniref:Glycoside hydrolase family 31 protein n=1 Tax=Marinigracilibium pacificum TaxID=2729599 RepID=A0A848J6V5_9BACT|nr:TIM-barrel domain-containing protein [Marinigracilibium pacificum]NMM50119.1 glycoside hydrolase family 31 protein [Marinigracilibium pacificum]